MLTKKFHLPCRKLVVLGLIWEPFQIGPKARRLSSGPLAIQDGSETESEAEERPPRNVYLTTCEGSISPCVCMHFTSPPLFACAYFIRIHRHALTETETQSGTPCFAAPAQVRQRDAQFTSLGRSTFSALTVCLYAVMWPTGDSYGHKDMISPQNTSGGGGVVLKQMGSRGRGKKASGWKWLQSLLFLASTTYITFTSFIISPLATLPLLSSRSPIFSQTPNPFPHSLPFPPSLLTRSPSPPSPASHRGAVCTGMGPNTHAFHISSSFRIPFL